jgi:hypothetical protein
VYTVSLKPIRALGEAWRRASVDAMV